VVRELQKRGGLKLVSHESQGPESVGETSPEVGVAPTEASGKRSTKPAKIEGAPSSKQISYRFLSNPIVLEEVLKAASLDSRYLAGRSIENFREVFQSVLSVNATSAVEVARADSGKHGPHSTLVLRSFRNVLDAVAQEQRAFDALARRDRAGFLDQIPARQQRPVLRTDWTSVGMPQKLLPPISSVNYMGTKYLITDDANGDPAMIDSRWNRDVFRLLIDLSSQVTVDITKFQRQVLELTQ
jgi:hypothetical protein